MERLPEGTDQKQLRINLDNFNSVLHKSQPEANIKRNAFAGNSKYIPIGIIESELDKYFQEWSWKIDSVSNMANAVVVYGRLEVLNPVTGNLITRSGCGSVPIEVAKGSNPNDINSINSKALQKNVPAAAAYALKNAAKTLGNLFGRNINRDDVQFTPIHSTREAALKEERKRLEVHIENSTTVDQLEQVLTSPEFMGDTLTKMYNDKKTDING